MQAVIETHPTVQSQAHVPDPQNDRWPSGWPRRGRSLASAARTFPRAGKSGRARRHPCRSLNWLGPCRTPAVTSCGQQLGLESGLFSPSFVCFAASWILLTHGLATKQRIQLSCGAHSLSSPAHTPLSLIRFLCILLPSRGLLLSSR
jgi:hypothetical protein